MTHLLYPTIHNLRIIVPIVTATKWLLKQFKIYAIFFFFLVFRAYSIMYSVVIVFLDSFRLVLCVILMTAGDLGLFHFCFQFLGIFKF